MYLENCKMYPEKVKMYPENGEMYPTKYKMHSKTGQICHKNLLKCIKKRMKCIRKSVGCILGFSKQFLIFLFDIWPWVNQKEIVLWAITQVISTKKRLESLYFTNHYVLHDAKIVPFKVREEKRRKLLSPKKYMGWDVGKANQ